MGSGRKGEHGSDGYSAWQRNIQAITSISAAGGTTIDFDGTAAAEDGSRYDGAMSSGNEGGSGSGPRIPSRRYCWDARLQQLWTDQTTVCPMPVLANV